MQLQEDYARFVLKRFIDEIWKCKHSQSCLQLQHWYNSCKFYKGIFPNVQRNILNLPNQPKIWKQKVTKSYAMWGDMLDLHVITCEMSFFKSISHF
jgi:hypothetical protein